MAFVCQLIEGSEDPINLFYSADDGWAMLEKGLQPNDPERRELWGGYLDNVLVRQEDGKRVIPMEFQGSWSSPDELIDAVNALEKRLRNAARYRTEGWGDEVFLRFQLHGSTYGVDFPVSSGSISKLELLNACASIMESGHRVTKTLLKVPVVVTCGDPAWKAQETYTLENYIDNPGFWRGAVAPGDSWTEVDPAANLTLAWQTGTRYVDWQVMGRSLKWTIAPDAVNDVGIRSDNQTVLASTEYYFECRGYHTVGCDKVTARVYDVSNAAVIAASVLEFDNGDDAWEKLGLAFTTPVGCVSIRVEMFRLVADSTAGNKTFYCDAFYVEPRSDAPTAWCSGRNLVNHLDSDADHLNVLCVTEIPGEVEAELSLVNIAGAVTTIDNLRVARRARNSPHNMIWDLLAADATVTAGDATCLDSILAADANAPGGQRVEVDFVGNQTMQKRCYWRISADLPSYYGRYAFILLARASAATDVIRAQIITYEPVGDWSQGGIETKTVTTSPAAARWRIIDGWELFSFPIGTHWGDQWGAGNYWEIQVQAEVAGAAAWDKLYIAGAKLIPLDDGYTIGGGNTGDIIQPNMETRMMDLDGDRGFFIYSPATSRHYSNAGLWGALPRLAPERENWLYMLGDWATTLTITHGWVASVEYRPRGIFLRGSNP